MKRKICVYVSEDLVSRLAVAAEQRGATKSGLVGAAFPVGAGIFQMAYAPAPRFEFVNTLGLPTYSWMVLDEKRDMLADVETLSYPLAVCTMPSALLSGKRTAAD
jgi:hypothetical protein